MNASNAAPGLLLLMLGIFAITRSVTKDDTGRTLIDRILGKPGITGSGQAALANGLKRTPVAAGATSTQTPTGPYGTGSTKPSGSPTGPYGTGQLSPAKATG